MSLAICPLTTRGSTRGQSKKVASAEKHPAQVLEALAAGTPVVTTSKGVEGLDLDPEDDLLVADKPADFAAAVLRLLQDTDLREALNFNGRQTVAAKYDWQVIGRLFENFIETVVIRTREAYSGVNRL